MTERTEITEMTEKTGKTEKTERTENRRVRMTKRLMKDALLELLEQRELSDISVTAVCDAADINRSTFYNYYSSPSELLRDIEQDVMDCIPNPPLTLDQETEEQLLKNTTAFFDYVIENKQTFRILFSETTNNDFSSRLVDLLCSQHIISNVSIDEKTLRFMQHYIANGTVGMLREWISMDFPVTSREIAEMMYSYSRKITG